ncbi:MAG: hypothetical protein ACTSW7_00570 [Candidatus Thorarchaeota archaeon]|nr:MAG: hypothetical protein DRP42_02835 [Mycoplasmatota bacterium]HEC72604.1 hypothetical protein [Thermoplasmatales archaeon]
MKTNKEHLKNSSRCPVCNNTDIEGGPVHIEDATAWQEIYCINCYSEWYELYDLVSYEIEYDGVEKVRYGIDGVPIKEED